jgi:hypothetical protein
MNAKEITQAVQRYVESGFSSVGIEYVIKTQPIQTQTKFWNRVNKIRKANG